MAVAVTPSFHIIAVNTTGLLFTIVTSVTYNSKGKREKGVRSSNKQQQKQQTNKQTNVQMRHTW
jgi:hypothetical protein